MNKRHTRKNKNLSKKRFTRKYNDRLSGIQKKPGSKIIFSDHREFTPNLTPRQMFKLGSFGGTYWRPIKSSVTNKEYKNIHKKYPKSWWEGIPENHLTRPFDKYDTKINKYGVKVGTTLEFWESKKWITKYNPYGWVHWYCDFFMGRRTPDDSRQIDRWLSLAGPRGRFMRFLVSLIIKKKAKYDDETISPKIRQVLQHWGYQLTKEDFIKEVKRRNNK